MQAIGNALTIVGIVVTFVAYFGQHSGVTLRDLEPGIASRWDRARGWLRRRMGRAKTITVNVNSAVSVSSALSARVSVWSPIQPGDDIAVRAEKLERNLDSLRRDIEAMREEGLERAREVSEGLRQRVEALDGAVAQQQEESRRRATAAMRWEVRGLLITLVGAGLGIVG